jgi:hypothetical protein
LALELAKSANIKYKNVLAKFDAELKKNAKQVTRK